MSFSRDIDNFKLDTEKGLDKFVRAVTLEFFSRVVLRSPVDTGRFRANWLASRNTPRAGTLEKVDKTGSSAIRDVRAKIGGAGGVNYLTNNLPYGERLELGSSKQAPQGMVRLALVEIESIIRRQIDAIR